jgi:hypothetical protein
MPVAAMRTTDAMNVRDIGVFGVMGLFLCPYQTGRALRKP